MKKNVFVQKVVAGVAALLLVEPSRCRPRLVRSHWSAPAGWKRIWTGLKTLIRMKSVLSK